MPRQYLMFWTLVCVSYESTFRRRRCVLSSLDLVEKADTIMGAQHQHLFSSLIRFRHIYKNIPVLTGIYHSLALLKALDFFVCVWNPACPCICVCQCKCTCVKDGLLHPHPAHWGSAPTCMAFTSLPHSSSQLTNTRRTHTHYICTCNLFYPYWKKQHGCTTPFSAVMIHCQELFRAATVLPLVQSKMCFFRMPQENIRI